MAQSDFYGAKWAFTTRNVNRNTAANVDPNVSQARVGDLVLASVKRIGSHKRVQLADGRNSELHLGDRVVLCCGNRYAPDQFEGIAKIDAKGADMLAGGGVIGHKRHAHESISRPTQLMPLGLVTDALGNVINIQRFALARQKPTSKLSVIAVTGTSMNSGKTTTAFSLVNGLSKLGVCVAAVKVTGTGAFGDFNAFVDAGAHTVLDFTDAGMPTTYRQPMPRIVEGAMSVIAEAQQRGAQIVVVELGDGLLQQEAWQLLNTPSFATITDGVIFAAPDAMSAITGLNMLDDTDLNVLGVSGLLTRSPLLCKEFSQVQDTPVFSRRQLSDPTFVQALLAQMFQIEQVA